MKIVTLHQHDNVAWHMMKFEELSKIRRVEEMPTDNKPRWGTYFVAEDVDGSCKMIADNTDSSD